jgi:putative nucleotidyltransferase with HDIG domain
MRRKSPTLSSDYRIIVVDDDPGIVRSVGILLKKSGYNFDGVTNPLEAVEKIKNGHYDMLILDYIMQPTNGDKVVENIREFNTDLYILLLTGHKDLAPPLETIKSLAIQGYCEKSDKFDQLLLLIESGIKSISQLRTIKRFTDGLNRILSVVPKIYQLQPIGDILNEILIGVMPLLHSENGFILVDNFLDNDQKKIIFQGVGNYNLEDFSSLLGYPLMEQIGYARESKHIVKMDTGIILPLMSGETPPVGIIYLESTDYEEGLKLIEIYASQAASSINNAFLHSLVNVKNEELNSTYNELKTRYLDTIEALRLTVDAKDVYTRGHSDRVAYFAAKIGELYQLAQDEVETLRVGGIFHDIGKIGTMDDILLKTSGLDEKEFTEIKKHPLKGAYILSAVSMFRDVVPIIKYHHERVDGQGYPEGLKGEAIPFLARILSVADAFDAMTSDRKYRSKLGLEDAKKQLVQGAGTQFDADVVAKFIKLTDAFEQMEQEIAFTFDNDYFC